MRGNRPFDEKRKNVNSYRSQNSQSYRRNRPMYLRQKNLIPPQNSTILPAKYQGINIRGNQNGRCVHQKQ